jgi:Ca-activated chloride channel family protein
MPELQTPLYLLLFIPLLLVFFISLKRKPATFKFSNIESMKAAGAHPFSWRRQLPNTLLLGATSLFIIAMTQPRKGVDKIKQRADGIDIVLAIDVSGSMQAIDIPDKLQTSDQLTKAYQNGKLENRMQVAKEELRKFVNKRPNDRIGLIAFAGKPFTICPPTLDHDFLLGHLQMLKAGMFSRTAGGTGLASPIAIATNNLKNSDAKRRVMVLFTDGSNNIDTTITPKQAALLAADYKIIIYTVGIGSSRIIINDMFGNPQVQTDQEFDDQMMKEIAKCCDGIYLKAQDQEAFAKAMDQVNKLEKTTIIQNKFTNYKQLHLQFILSGLILLLLAFLLQHTYCLRIP